jgi:thiol-disulfide isomerase/thioredoxin
VSSMLIGVATGLLWTPCAGPILGLLLTGAAVRTSGFQTWTLLLTFAVGAACPLAIALLAGGKAFELMKRSLPAEEWIRRGLGIAVLAGAAAISMGWDQSILSRMSLSSQTGIEQSLLDRFGGSSGTNSAGTSIVPGGVALDDKGLMPELAGASHWINSAPLTRESLKGNVVLVDFWTYSCINCLRALPYVRNWAKKYSSAGLVVIGIHSPEFAFERDESNVERAVRELNIQYPVANDSEHAIWDAFANRYWPAHYFIDIRGHIRYSHFGEGDYGESELLLQRLLAERNGKIPRAEGIPQAAGVEAPASVGDIQSHETYTGNDRQENMASPEEVIEGRPVKYTVPQNLALNKWALRGGGMWVKSRLR